MDISILRSWWAQRQGLDGSLAGKPAATILERSGWARSVGGVGPYLAMWARGGNSRESMDAAAATCEIHELPAARNCTYVVPASDFALALRAGGMGGVEAEMRTARKLGVTDAEIDHLCKKVVDALTAVRGQALDPEKIREATGNASRSLGPEAQKKGLTTTLPLALGRLQLQGDIRRVPTNGRLDQQRYAYAAWSPNPLAKFKMTQEEVNVELARRYFRWIGPATLGEFQWFSGLGVKAAKAAMEPLGLVAFDSERGMFAEDLEALRSLKRSKDAHYTLVSSLDSMVLLRRDPKLLIEDEDHAREVRLEKGCGTLGGLNDLPSHAILDRGRLVGLWEFDPRTQSIAWMSFIKPNKDLRAAVAACEAFVRDQLGDARSFSLDSAKSREPRIAGLRKLQPATA